MAGSMMTSSTLRPDRLPRMTLGKLHRQPPPRTRPLQGAGDVIVFDEAHHLSKIEGAAVTQRYRLAERLQGRTDSLVFLTGTPHQGKTAQFANVLLLLRPDLKSRLGAMFSDPSVVAEVELRKRKSLVTDAAGSCIFRGQDTNLVEVPLSDAARNFDQQLRRYIRDGYAASDAGGVTGRAVGYVMTTYRKLASSSIAAIERALERRRARLTGELNSRAGGAVRDRFEELQDAFEEGDDGADDLAVLLPGRRGCVTGVPRARFDRRRRPCAAAIRGMYFFSMRKFCCSPCESDCCTRATGRLPRETAVPDRALMPWTSAARPARRRAGVQGPRAGARREAATVRHGTGRWRRVRPGRQR